MFPADARAPSALVQAIYEEHHGWLHGLLRRRLNCPHSAADLAHDTFLRILHRPEVLPGLREPRAYLTTIARGLLSDHWRRHALEAAWLETLATLGDDHLPGPDEALSIRQALQQLDDLLHGLGARVREVFLLSQLQGLPYAQIAARTGLSERTVKRYMAQGFERCLSAMLA